MNLGSDGSNSNLHSAQMSTFESFLNQSELQLKPTSATSSNLCDLAMVAGSRSAATRLLDIVFVDRASLLALRAVAKVFRDWTSPSVFRKMTTTYPPLLSPVHDPRSRAYDSYNRIKQHIQILHLKIRPTCKTDYNPSITLLESLLDLPQLECLSLELLNHEDPQTHQIDVGLSMSLWIWSTDNLLDCKGTTRPAHHHTLVNLRGALEHNAQTLGKLSTLQFTNLSITGIQALRFRPFSGYKLRGHRDDNSGWRGTFWPRIKTLEICVVKWWKIR